MSAVQTRPQLTFDEKHHRYYLGDQRVPGVTSILACIAKPFLLDWYGRVGGDEARRISRESADFGRAVHAACERIVKAEPLDYLPFPDEILPFANAYNEWLSRSVRRVIGAEMMLAHPEHLYAGTADVVVELYDGSIAIVDVKTSANVSEDFGAQTEAYRRALRVWEGIDATRRLIVHMPRKQPGVIEVHEILPETQTQDWRAFLAASILFHRYFKAEAFAPRRNILGRKP